MEIRPQFGTFPASSLCRDTWQRERGQLCPPAEGKGWGRAARPSTPSLVPDPHPPALSLSQERPVEVGDWRKNVEAMSGMEGRKKMFDAAKSPTGQ